VSAGKVRLSCLDHGKIGTNDWNFVEVKTTLPAEDAFKEVSTGATEEEVERRFGKPTWEQDRNATINWKKMPANTRVVSYQWCAVSPKSESGPSAILNGPNGKSESYHQTGQQFARSETPYGVACL
jgi:hypothetical protein